MKPAVRTGRSASKIESFVSLFAPFVRLDSPMQSLVDQRDQVKRFFADLDEATDAVEREIAESLHQFTADLAIDAPRDDARSARVNERLKQVERREAELESQQEELSRREGELAEARRRLETEKQSLGDDARRRREEAEEAERRRARVDERSRRLESREEELETERERTKNQRRRIAAELREERERSRRERRAALDEIDSARDDLRRATDDLERRRAELDRRAAEQERTQSTVEHDADSSRRLQAAERALHERDAEVESLQTELELLRERLADYRAKTEEIEAELDRLRAAGEEPGDAEEWRHKYLEAAEEVRDLQRRNALLERSDRNVASGSSGDALPMDWESQKRRLLAALESDYDSRDPKTHNDRLTIEGTIQITDGVVAEKEREIDELRSLLEGRKAGVTIDYSGDNDSNDVDRANDDEIVQRIRAETEQLRQQWEAKLREAEVELSIERAALARRESEFDDRRAEFEKQQRQSRDQAATSLAAEKGDRKPAGNRWLARLGLRDGDAS